MKAIRLVVAVLAGIGLNLGAAGVWAESWTLVPPTGNLGNSHPYSGSSGTTITATGWLAGTSTATALYGKNSGLNETGLGIAAEVNNEISTSYVVDLNLANLVSQGVLSGSLTIESAQNGEGVEICAGPTSSTGHMGSVDCVVKQGPPATFNLAVSWTSADPVLTITADNLPSLPAGNIVIEGLTTASKSVPEPSSLLLIGSGLLGLAGLVRLRFNA